ncbi:MAG: NAD-dependent epimerase/dehydratase family protein, partial [Burkholderiaceae bacterium]
MSEAPVQTADDSPFSAPSETVLNSTQRIAITGATGFIGRHLCEALRQQGISVVPLSRRQTGIEGEVVADLAEPNSLAQLLKGANIVVHCAGYAHAHEEYSQGDEKHQLVNRDYALNTARAAASAGVRRFVFCSSVKAVGEPADQRADESFTAPPETSYGRAKHAAEHGLAEIGAATGMEIVILRFAMVYGPGSRGNFERMLESVARRRFPPLPETENKRSMVHVSDAVSALILAARHPAAAGRTYIAAHPHAVSGRELYLAMRSACSLPRSRWAVPAWILRSAGKGGDLIGKLLGRRMPLDGQAVDRLLNSAWYSPAALQKEIGWMPRIDLDEGLISLSAPDRSSGPWSKR